jgi:hypothetical protein
VRHTLKAEFRDGNNRERKLFQRAARHGGLPVGRPAAEDRRWPNFREAGLPFLDSAGLSRLTEAEIDLQFLELVIHYFRHHQKRPFAPSRIVTSST